MKKLLFLVVVLFSFATSFAQEEMEDMIFSYTDSTQLLVEKGRKLIVKNISEQNFAEADKVLNYLNKKAGATYVVLYPNEEILASIALRNFQLFLYDARHYSTLMEGKKKFPKYEDISYELHANIKEQMMVIIQDLEMAELPEEDKQMVSLYLDYYNNEDKLVLKSKINDYLKEYPETEYKEFLKQIKTSTFTGRFNFGFGYLNETLSGEITNTIDSNISGMVMEMDFVFNTTYLTLYVGGNLNSMQSRKDLDILNTDWIYLEGYEIATVRYGLKIGQIVSMNRWMKTYPYINIGGFSVTAQSDDIDEDDKNELMGCFMPGFGIASEMNLVSWSSNSIYGPTAYVYLKPNVEFNFLTTKREQFKGQSLGFSLTLGIAFGNF